MRVVIVGLVSLFTLFIRPIDAGAEPTWEFPWPNDKSQSDPAYDISGYTYCGPSHDVEGPGAWNSPGEWDAKAIDFGLTDDLVSAAADGIVAKIRDAPFSTSGFGTYVILEHLGFFTMYAHLSDYPAWLDDGDRVRAGEVLATSGDTGCCGLHLHFQPGKGSRPSRHTRLSS